MESIAEGGHFKVILDWMVHRNVSSSVLGDIFISIHFLFEFLWELIVDFLLCDFSNTNKDKKNHHI